MSADRPQFPQLVIAQTASIRDAMEMIDSNGREMVLVRDGADRIVGLISDGDIRRGLLSGQTLDVPVDRVMTRDFFTVAADVERVSILDVMKARSFQHVPVLDADRRLVAIHFLRDLIGATPKPNIAVVMAGGRGTRLYPVTEKIPKPMIEVAGRPMLERIVLHLVGYGIRTIYISVNFMAEVIEKHFGDGSEFGCRVEYLRESMPLGTGGALSLLPKRPEHPFLVLNGDLVSRADLAAMLDAHTHRQLFATVGIGTHQMQVPFGTVREDGGHLLSLTEKPTVNFLINRGIYVLDPAALEFVPKHKDYPMTDLFEALLAANKPVGVFVLDDPWIDVGHIEDLRRAQRGS